MGKKYSTTFNVGIYQCEMTYTQRLGLNVQWSPDLPNRPLSKQEMAQYRAGRDALTAIILKDMGGGAALVVEI